VNPVFELEGAPKRCLTITRDQRKLGVEDYGWDGQVLWLDATIVAQTELGLTFGGAE
jgi:hypothetical protein